MRLKKAARPRHCINSLEARGVDETADHVDTIANPTSQLLQAVPLRAELTGDTCSAAGLRASGHAPVLALARMLIDAGHNPATPLEVFRGDMLCLTVRAIGEAARLAVEDDRYGRPRFRRWRGRRYGAGSPIAQKGRGEGTASQTLPSKAPSPD